MDKKQFKSNKTIDVLSLEYSIVAVKINISFYKSKNKMSKAPLKALACLPYYLVDEAFKLMNWFVRF